MNERPKLPPQLTGSMQQFAFLVGEWTMVGSHPQPPSPAHGHSSFEWLREGSLLVWHFNWERGGPPNALSVIGHDDEVETCSLLYTDELGVASIYQMSLEGGVWKMGRDSSGFSQRVTGTFSGDGKIITCQGELSRDGPSILEYASRPGPGEQFHLQFSEFQWYIPPQNRHHPESNKRRCFPARAAPGPT